MLVLGRKRGQDVWIEPAGIKLTIVNVDKRTGLVRLGIHAPHTQTIRRGELLERYELLRLEAERLEAEDAAAQER